MKARTIMEKLNSPSLPIFNKSRQAPNTLGFDIVSTIEAISKNREKIPLRYWDGENLNIARESVTLERQGTMTTEFIMVGKKGDICKMTVRATNYTDTYECGGKEFGDYVKQIKIDPADQKKLRELYILSKDDVTLPDLLHCENMEIRRDAIKKMGYLKVRTFAKIIDTFEEYDLLDLRYREEDFGRFLKMVDSTSKETYLLQVPRTRDFGTVKIPMTKAKQALAWSFAKQEHQYHPTVET